MKNTKKTALLVVDVQIGLFTQNTPVYKEDQLIGNLLKIIKFARNAHIPVVFIQHSNKGILKKGSQGWMLHPDIKPLNDEAVIQKVNASAFKETELDILLKKSNIQNLIIMGLTTHGCVKATVLDAVKLNYHVSLVKDAHSSFSTKAGELIDYWNRKLTEKGISVVAAREFTV